MRRFDIRWQTAIGNRMVNETLIATGIHTVFGYCYRAAVVVADKHGGVAFPVIVHDVKNDRWYDLPEAFFFEPVSLHMDPERYRQHPEF